MIYLLDTDHNSVLQRGGEGAVVLERRLRALGRDDYGTNIVSYEEQCRGWTDYIHRANTPEARIDGYARLRASLRFYSSIAVWEYDAVAETIFVALTEARCALEQKTCVSPLLPLPITPLCLLATPATSSASPICVS